MQLLIIHLNRNYFKIIFLILEYRYICLKNIIVLHNLCITNIGLVPCKLKLKYQFWVKFDNIVFRFSYILYLYF